jgi:hypothetical protein
MRAWTRLHRQRMRSEPAQSSEIRRRFEVHRASRHSRETRTSTATVNQQRPKTAEAVPAVAGDTYG